MAGDKERLKRRIKRLVIERDAALERVAVLERAIREHVDSDECGWRSLGEAIGVLPEDVDRKRLADGRAA